VCTDPAAKYMQWVCIYNVHRRARLYTDREGTGGEMTLIAIGESWSTDWVTHIYRWDSRNYTLLAKVLLETWEVVLIEGHSWMRPRVIVSTTVPLGTVGVSAIGSHLSGMCEALRRSHTVRHSHGSFNQ